MHYFYELLTGSQNLVNGHRTLPVWTEQYKVTQF